MLRRQSLRSFARNAKGFLKIKLANIGTSDVHAILFTFDCEENLKNFLSTLVYYLRNEWIFKNHELTNLIDNLAPQFIDLYCSYAPGDGRESFFHSMVYLFISIYYYYFQIIFFHLNYFICSIISLYLFFASLNLTFILLVLFFYFATLFNN